MAEIGIKIPETGEYLDASPSKYIVIENKGVNNICHISKAILESSKVRINIQFNGSNNELMIGPSKGHIYMHSFSLMDRQ